MAPNDRTTSPAFQFYPKDFLSSSKVQRMSLTEIGAYTVLLSHAWLSGGIPADVAQLAKIVKVPVAQFRRMWAGALSECFIERKGVLINERLDAERRKQIEYRRRQSDHGRKGGRRVALSEPAGSERASPSTRDWRQESSSPSSHSSKEKKVESDFDGQRAFMQLVAAYPKNRVVAGQRTSSEFCAAVFADDTPEATFALMLERLENHKRSHEWRVKGMAPALDKWISQCLWLRLMDEEPSAGEPKPSGQRVPEWAAKARANAAVNE